MSDKDKKKIEVRKEFRDTIILAREAVIAAKVRVSDHRVQFLEWMERTEREIEKNEEEYKRTERGILNEVSAAEQSFWSIMMMVVAQHGVPNGWKFNFMKMCFEPEDGDAQGAEEL